MAAESKKPIFEDLNADNDEQDVTEIESLCMKCYKQVIRQYKLAFKISWFIYSKIGRV